MFELIKTLLRKLDPLRGFLTIPGLITLGGLVLAFATMQLDVQIDKNQTGFWVQLIDIDYGPAQALLSSLTTASMSALSLVYSSVLVVFTLAAGNIGPRLLQRFTDDRLSQVAVGMLGATFLYSLIVLRFTSDGNVHRFSVLVAVILAGMSVILLLIFVNAVARRVTIDEEVAAIALELDNQIEIEIGKEQKQSAPAEVSAPPGPKMILNAQQSGYVSYLAPDFLIELAEKNGLFIEVLVSPGDYMLPDMPVAEVTGNVEASVAEEILNGIALARSRSPDGDLRFSIHLMVEIAIRALSPGINDSYTAIVCIDRLSSSVAWARKKGLHHGSYTDENGIPRLKTPRLTSDDLLIEAFAPIRRNARGNVMVLLTLIDALARIAEVSGRAEGDQIATLLERIGDEIDASDLIADDEAKLRDRLEAVQHRFYPSADV
ncbi:DUF2254 domain-containing protein [Paracoccaceae bacterium GXU_MW_L88]